VFRRKDVSAVKAFITTRIDRIRPPYGRSIEFLPRRSVFCGTTNEREFLSDPTGNRRFWIVPMGKRLDFAALESERDQIWAAAVSLYQSGVRWNLTHEEEQEAKAIARQYESSDAWHDEVADWIECRERCSIQEILTDCLRIELHSQSKKEELRVRGILMRLNWQQITNPQIYKGKKVRFWEPPKDFSPDLTVPLCQDAPNEEW
jgi:predicted P-loop ATPase